MIAPILAITGTVTLFFLWINERNKRQDFETDLRTVVVKNDLDSRDLRRSLRHKSFRDFIIQRSENQLEDALKEAKLDG